MKYIEGYEMLYSVTRCGKIWSHKSDKYLKCGVSKGYEQVALYKDGKAKRFSVHRLVATAYIQNPETKKTVNHKDSDRRNNHVENLEWSTYQENNKHAWNCGNQVFNQKMRETTAANFTAYLDSKRLPEDTADKVALMKNDGLSNRAIARFLGIAHSSVNKLVTNMANGY